MTSLAGKRPFRYALVAAVIFLTVLHEPALAQAPNPLGNLLGGMIRAGEQASAKKAWAALPQPMQLCMDRGLSTQRQSIQNLINQGVAPNDSRLSQDINRCQTLTSKVLRSNVDCTVVDNGASIKTRCNDSYAEIIGPQTRLLNFEQYVDEGFRGGNVAIALVETNDARQARLAQQQQQQQQAASALQQQQQQAAAAAQKQQEQAAEERRKFLESPEGKRQVADDAAKAKQSEAAAAAAQAAQQAKISKEFPYYAVFTCGTGFGHITMTACIGGDAATTLEIKNGDEYGNYNLVRIISRQVPHAQETRQGYVVDLRSSFEITAQNSEKDLMLGLKILDRATNKVLFQKEVSSLGVIKVGH